ncbi:PREDICTED: F-box/FBD/LRR-repeat protein At5g56420-like [Camelina sativa]|uniref:F-box/FBD/LRR-repeat protein At5g56420-like n=1 Tax=Camelina sativa TaxID=90675 RepID=A0ABM0VYR0_CAMSA|nr:PREDICTED: F-box/FBD/LRR-repeat protein At5g56420-like [Camelina sativa]
MVLSKRWKFLWMLVPRLRYDRDEYQVGACESMRFRRLIHTSLVLHKVPVIESLNISISPMSDAYEDIQVCVGTAIERGVRELCIHTEICSTGFLIDAPSLELLEINKHMGGFCRIEHNMPKIEAANVYVTCSDTEQILSSLTSVEQLRLCLATSKVTKS